MEKLRDLIENYQTNINQSEKLHKKLIKLLDYNTKITAEYSHNTISGKGSVSSKVENHVIKICNIEEKILEVEERIYKVNIAEKVLNNEERKVVDLVKIYRNRLTEIGKILNKDKSYVFNTRNRAIKKMEEYIGRQ